MARKTTGIDVSMGLALAVMVLVGFFAIAFLPWAVLGGFIWLALK